jgi:hypothetical protein
VTWRHDRPGIMMSDSEASRAGHRGIDNPAWPRATVTGRNYRMIITDCYWEHDSVIIIESPAVIM